MQLTVSYIDQILVLLIFTVSLNLVMGYAGVFNAAAGAFGAIGGYSLVWLTANHGWAFIPAMLVGIAVAGVFGLLVGWAALRLQALWLLLLTLAVQLVLIGTLSGLTSLGGSTGLQTNNLTILGYQLVEPTQVLPVVAVGAVIVFALCYRIGESPYGRVLRGIRDDETATRSLGKNTFTYKLVVFCLTAAMGGFAGVLLSADTTTASPSLYGFDVSIQVIAMVIIGGTANMFGSIVGVTLVVLATPFFENVIHLSTNVASLTQQLAYGLALVIIVFFRPQGIIPEGVVPWRWRRAAPVPAAGTGAQAPQHVRAALPAPLASVRERAPAAAAGPCHGPAGSRAEQVLRRQQGGQRPQLRPAPRYDHRAHRAQRRGQDHGVQPDHRGHPSRHRGGPAVRAGHHRAAPGHHHRPRNGPVVPGRPGVPVAHGAGEHHARHPAPPRR
jgi:branched-chain amino acid transport system permease protein